MQNFDLGLIGGRLQTAALHPDMWPDVLDEVSRKFGGAGAQFFSRRRRLPIQPASQSLEDWSREYLADGWQERSERRIALETLRGGQVPVDQDFMTRDSIARSPFYQELLTKHALAWVACVGFGIGDDVWGIAIQRPVGSEP